jgi:hypothetical protein
VEAFQHAGLRPILYYASAREREPLRFTHGPTGAEVRVLPSPRLHCKARVAHERYRPGSPALRTIATTCRRPCGSSLGSSGRTAASPSCATTTSIHASMRWSPWADGRGYQCSPPSRALTMPSAASSVPCAACPFAWLQGSSSPLDWKRGVYSDAIGFRRSGWPGSGTRSALHAGGRAIALESRNDHDCGDPAGIPMARRA